MDTTRKKCPRCEQTKDKGEFHKRRQSKDGRATYCKLCSKEKQREWKDKNREHVRQQNREWHRDNRDRSLAKKAEYREELRRQVFTHYCGGTPACQCCGETILTFLSIDHIDGGGHQHRQEIERTGGTEFFFWLRREGYPEGYQVLCRNCNWGKHANGGVCPHQEV